jgi:Raf kinase inhibitor-like YbhB/YbcL family protein
MLFLLLACTDEPKDDSATPDETGPDTSDDTAPDDTGGALAVWLPAATSSDGDPLADRCDWKLDVTYECENGNPEVRWSGAPEGTVAFALVFDDPDAGEFDHWAIVNVPADETGIEAGVSGQGLGTDLPEGSYELENGFGFTGYLGSCPPAPHVYRWRLWALSTALDEGLSRFSQVERQAEERALGVAETCHIYGPKAE